MGKFQAMRMLLSGCQVTAEQALAMGLISELVDDREVLARGCPSLLNWPRCRVWPWSKSRRWRWSVPS